jgi:tetratricopeptide (TPR) repeat protein
MLDLGDFDAARPYLAIAARAAQQIDDAELMAFTLGCRAFHAAYSDSPSKGLGFAEAGLDVAARGIHPATHGWVSAVASEMNAATGEANLCTQLLQEAADHLHQPVDRPWVGIGVFNDAKLAAYRGGGLMRLGRHRDAQTELLVALQSLDPALRKHRCTAHVDLAEAYLQDNKVDEAAGQGIEALDIVADTRHADSVRRVERLYRTVRATRAESVRQLGNRLVEFKAVS